MIHELKEIINQAIINQEKGLKNVLASVVFLKGSSYRKPGVRMLISEDFTTVGAVSGGCVEKEIMQRSKSVFESEKAKIITYDGRYNLGCEGILYVLIEPFFVSTDCINTFLNSILKRKSIAIESIFVKKDEAIGNYGSTIKLEEKLFHFSKSNENFEENEVEIYTQILKPAFRLIIIGGEHDAVKLCTIAANLGWEIQVITSEKEVKKLTDFPGATSVIGENPETIKFENINSNSAIVIMNHSYVQDLKYLIKLTEYQPKYIGILGAPNRRERMFNELFEFAPELSESFLDTVFTPAGINLNAQTPKEIAVSIIAEIMAVINKTEVTSLRNITGKIHP